MSETDQWRVVELRPPACDTQGCRAAATGGVYRNGVLQGHFCKDCCVRQLPVLTRMSRQALARR